MVEELFCETYMAASPRNACVAGTVKKEVAQAVLLSRGTANTLEILLKKLY